MINQEFTKLIKSKKSVFIMLYFWIAVIVKNITDINMSKSSSIHPMGSTLLADLKDIYIPFVMIFWLLPLLLILLYADKYVIERKTGALNIYLVKMSRKKYFYKKILCSFVFSIAVTAAPLMGDFLLSCIINHGKSGFGGLEYIAQAHLTGHVSGPFLAYSINHPYIAYFMYFFGALALAGVCGIFCQSVCFIFNNNKIASILTFAVWMALYSTKYDISMIIQPFTEYDYFYGTIAFLEVFAVMSAALIGAYIKFVRKKDAI